MKYIIAVLLVLFASFTDIFLFRISVIPVQPSSFLLPLFLVVSAIHYSIQDMLAIFRSHTFKLFLAIALLSIIYSAVSSAPTDIIIEEIVLNILTVLLYAYMLQFFRKESKWLIFIVVFGAFTVLAGSVWYDYLIGLPKFDLALEQMVRKGGFGENPNQASSAMKFLALTILVFLQDKKLKRITVIIMMVASVFLTFSRSGIISILLILILGTLNNWQVKFNITPHKLVRSIFNMVFLLVGIYIGLVSLVGVLRNEFPELNRGAMGERIDLLLGKGDKNVVSEDIGSREGRGDLLFSYSSDFVKKPLGYGTAFTSDRRYNSRNTHNYYLFLAVNFGIVAIIVYIVYLFRSLNLSFRYNQFYYLIFVILLIFEGLVDHHMYINRSILISLAFFDSLIYRSH